MKLNPYFAIILAATIGGFHGVFIKLINLPSTTIAFFRMFIPFIALIFFVNWKKLFRGDYKLMLTGSGLNAIRMFLYIVSFTLTTVANAVIMLFTWPFFAALFSIIFLKEKISNRTLVLILTSFFGIVIMYLNKEISLQNTDFLGMGIMLISAAMYASTVIIFKKGLKVYSNSETIIYQNFLGGMVFIPFIFLNPIPSSLEISLTTIMAFLVGVVAFSLFFYALKKIKVSHFSLMSYWEAPAAIIFSIIFFRELITINMVLGGLMILISGILLQKKQELPAD